MAGAAAVQQLMMQNPGKRPSELLRRVQMRGPSKKEEDKKDERSVREVVERHRERGNELFKRGDYAGAVAEYDAGLRAENSAVLRCNRAVALRKMERYEDALSDCHAALRLDAAHTKALLTGATCAASLGLFEESASLYEGYLEHFPADMRAKADLARAQQLAADVRMATSLRDSNPQRALACMRAASAEAPRSLVVRALEADILVRCGKYGNALSLCGEWRLVGVEGLKGVQMDWDLVRARALRGMGRLEEALGKYRAVMVRDPDSEECKAELRLLRQMCDQKEKADSLLGSRLFGQAEGVYTEALKLGEGDALSDAFHAAMLFGRGRAREKMGRGDDAVLDFTRALDCDGTMGKAALHRGRLFVKRGEYSEAVRDFELCLELFELCKDDYELFKEGSRGLVNELERARAKEKTEGKDHYVTLGVKPDVSEAEINKAYKKLALQHHPDKQTGQSDGIRAKAERTFRRIKNAHEILSDPAKRREFDQTRTGGGGGGDWGSAEWSNHARGFGGKGHFGRRNNK